MAGNQKERLLKAFKGHQGCARWRLFCFGIDPFARTLLM
jgi:hypothetical protein